MQQLPPSLERAWRKLRQHFKHARAFNVLYLFCSEPRLLALLQARSDEYLQLHVRRQSIIKPKDASGLAQSLSEVIESSKDEGARAVSAPVWLDWSAFGGPQNEDALASALTRLNASRSTLETRFQRLLIVALPEHAMRLLGAAAPDMWHIRTLTETLVSTPDELAALSSTNAAPTPLAETHDGVTLAEADYPTSFRLWLEAQASATTEEQRAELPLWVANDAVRELLARGALAQAADVAEDMRELAEARHSTRDLSVSWNKLGDIAQARGRLDEAEQAFRESKTLVDTRYRAQPTSENTRDLLVSWNKLGGIAMAWGRLDEAEQAYRESKTLADTLYREWPTPKSTRDLSICWDRLGDIAQAGGRLDEAEQAYGERKTLSDTLYRAQPTPESTRDLSISWERLGSIAQARGRLDEAEQAFRESKTLAEALHRAQPTPENTDDLSTSWVKLGDIAQARGRLDEAERAYGESKILADALYSAQPTPENTRGLSISWDRLGDIARARGRLDEAELAYREGKTLRDALYRAQPSPENTRYLSISWDRLGDIARARGRLDEAELAYREGKTLRDALYTAQPTPENMRDLSISWERLGEIAKTRGRLDEAEQAYREGKTLAEALYRVQSTPENTRGLLVSWERLGDIARARDRLDEASDAYLAAIVWWQQLQSMVGDQRDTVRGTAVVLERLASVLVAPQQRAEKRAALSKAETCWLRLATAFPDDSEFAESLVRVRGLLDDAVSSGGSETL